MLWLLFFIIIFCVLFFSIVFLGYNVYGQLGQGHTSYLGDSTNEMGNYLPPINLGSGIEIELCFHADLTLAPTPEPTKAPVNETGEAISTAVTVIFGVGMVGVILYAISLKATNKGGIELEQAKRRRENEMASTRQNDQKTSDFF